MTEFFTHSYDKLLMGLVTACVAMALILMKLQSRGAKPEAEDLKIALKIRRSLIDERVRELVRNKVVRIDDVEGLRDYLHRLRGELADKLDVLRVDVVEMKQEFARMEERLASIIRQARP